MKKLGILALAAVLSLGLAVSVFATDEPFETFIGLRHAMIERFGTTSFDDITEEEFEEFLDDFSANAVAYLDSIEAIFTADGFDVDVFNAREIVCEICGVGVFTATSIENEWLPSSSRRVVDGVEEVQEERGVLYTVACPEENCRLGRHILENQFRWVPVD